MGHRYPAAALVILLAVGIGGGAQAPTDQVFGWLRGYANQPVRKLASDPMFAALVQLSVPDVGVRMGRDANLAEAFTTQIRNSKRRVLLRDGRYLSFSGSRADGGVSQSFFWVDLQQDRALGAIYMQLAHDGGRPRLLVFSRREAGAGATAQLPADFVAALAAWQRAARLPAVMAQYFAGARGQRLLLHSGEDCQAAFGGNAPKLARCDSVNRDAAEIDMAEAIRLLNRRAPGGAAALAEEQAAWRSKRNADCAAPSASSDCLTRKTRQRAEELVQRMPTMVGAGPCAAARPGCSSAGPAAPRVPLVSRPAVTARGGMLTPAWGPCGPKPALRFAGAAPILPAGKAARPPRNAADVGGRGAPLVPPVPIVAPDPRYTAEARQARVEGRIYLDIVIGANGRVSGPVRVENHLGYGLDEAAVAAVQQWRWRPGTRHGVPVDVPARIEMTFHLRG